MNVTRFLKKITRVIELGPAQSVHLVKNRIHQGFFAKQWRTKALQQKAAHSWHMIAKKHAISWNSWWPLLTQQDLSCTTLDATKTLLQAQQIIHNKFDILGSGLQEFAAMPWHEDFRLKQQNPNTQCRFDDRLFYKDIVIAYGATEELAKDIKVPWELSRCQHLPIIGHAYILENNPEYAHKFRHDITDWIEKNPYLLGVNWVCPMEVGIRAINWIWAWHFFKHAPELHASFWQLFTSSLYDHTHYLENNWEFYDGRTSNHYLSDLVGYYYLCWFFQSIPEFRKKALWCHQEILREWDKQVFDEGTDYEGSTQYHRLVTELFSHFLLISESLEFTVPQHYHQKFQRMNEFITWCTPHNGTLISIGDHDSGRVTAFPVLAHPSYGGQIDMPPRLALPAVALLSYGGQAGTIGMQLPPSCPTCPSKPWRSRRVARTELRANLRAIKHFPRFGITILKTDNTHLTLRHHAYITNQPSGHIHNDALSLTLSHHGIPLFVDPGSYIYTPSAVWRNAFRSAAVHNTFYLKNHEPIPFDDRLFALNIPTNTPELNASTLESAHTLYARFGLKAERSIQHDPSQITIADRWHALENYDAHNFLVSCWNFTLHPDITPVKNNGAIELWHNNDIIATIRCTDLDFYINDAWVSEAYGSKKKSLCLRANMALKCGLADTRPSFQPPLLQSYGGHVGQDGGGQLLVNDRDTSLSVLPEGSPNVVEDVLEGSSKIMATTITINLKP